MKIRLSELKKIIRQVISEDYNSPTIPAELDPYEQNFSQTYPKWGNPQPKELRRSSPAEVKAKQVTAILTKQGLTNNPSHKKKIVQDLVSFIESMNPAELFSADPEDIAQDFSEQVLGVNNLSPPR